MQDNGTVDHECGIRLVMANKNCGDADRAQKCFQLVAQRIARTRIDCGERLVEQVGADGQGSGQGGALFFVGAALLREAVLAAGLRPAYGNVSVYTLGFYGRLPRPSDSSFALHRGARFRLEMGMVFHLYVSAGGTAISETVVVRPEGGERLSRLPRRALQGGDA